MASNTTTARPELTPAERRRKFLRNALPVAACIVAVLVGFGVVSSIRSSGHVDRIALPPTPPTPKTVKIAPAELKAMHGVVKQFVFTAVAHKNLAEAYRLIGPALKQDITAKQWRNGQVTVVPYPVSAKTHLVWNKKPEYSYADSA